MAMATDTGTIPTVSVTGAGRRGTLRRSPPRWPMLMLTPRPILGTATMAIDTMAMATATPTGTTAMDTGAGRRGRLRPPPRPRLPPMPTPRLTLMRGTVTTTDTPDTDTAIGMDTTGPTDTATGVKFYDINSA